MKSSTSINEHPIIMQPESVRGILEGRKTQTRRLVGARWQVYPGTMMKWSPECPYGRVGDRLWVREPYCRLRNNDNVIAFKEDDPDCVPRLAGRWNSPMFMPRSASRITLGLTDITVRRLMDITPADCMKEGIVGGGPNKDLVPRDGWRMTYAALWNRINGKKAPWASNPYVWVLEFVVVKP